MSDLVTDTGATFSDCGKYRYDLWRLWDADKPTLTFIMLNPSTADSVENDATIERCQRRAIMSGYGQLRVVNLMAFRATNPADLKPLSKADRFGPENKNHLKAALKEAGTVICGWGRDGCLGPVNWLTSTAEKMGVSLLALKTNKDGSPQHPLYIGYAIDPKWWGGYQQNSSGQ